MYGFNLYILLFKITLSNNHNYTFKVIHTIDSKEYSLKPTP